MMDNPFYSVCKLGSTRFFWAAWASYDTLCAHEVLGSGYTTIREEAHQQAQTAVGPHGNDYGTAGFAASYHRFLAAQARTARLASKPPSITGAAPTEYLYNERWNEDCETRYTPHRIIKKTARKVFINRESGWLDRPERYAEHPEWLRTIALDRATLERTGKASSGHGYFNDYYTREAMERERDDRARAHHPICVAALGLSWPCTLNAVKQAWRELARKLHPDAGGDAEAFREMRAHYEAAVQMIGGTK